MLYKYIYSNDDINAKCESHEKKRAASLTILFCMRGVDIFLSTKPEESVNRDSSWNCVRMRRVAVERYLRCCLIYL